MLESVQMMAQAEPQVDLFAQKRVEIMMDMATKKVQAEMQQLRQQVQKLEGEVSDLRRRVSEQAAQQPVQRVFAPVEQASHSVQQRPIDFSPERKVSADTPRYGKYTSDDVSVEKFFNYGTGRKR